MEYEQILAGIARHITLSGAESDLFCEKLVARKVRKKEFLLLNGEVCRHSIFVNKGILRGFTIDNLGVEHVLNFACSGWWIADMYSLFSQQPGQLNIQAVADAEIWLLPKIEQDHLYLKIPKLERFFRILVENALVANQQRLIDNFSLTAADRYHKFETQFPELTAQTPQKFIASFLGVTPEFFSKMRGKARGNK